MRQTQNFYQVYELSGSAFQLGLTGLAQGIPLFVFGLFGGTLADFVDRRKLLLLTIAGNLLVAIALGILTNTGAIRVWHVLIGTALASFSPHECGFPELQRFARRSFYRPDAGGTHACLDDHRQRIFL